MLNVNSGDGGEGDLFNIKTQLFPNLGDGSYSQIRGKHPVYTAKENRLGLSVLLSSQTSSFCLREESRWQMAEYKK